MLHQPEKASESIQAIITPVLTYLKWKYIFYRTIWRLYKFKLSSILGALWLGQILLLKTIILFICLFCTLFNLDHRLLRFLFRNELTQILHIWFQQNFMIIPYCLFFGKIHQIGFKIIFWLFYLFPLVLLEFKASRLW